MSSPDAVPAYANGDAERRRVVRYADGAGFDVAGRKEPAINARERQMLDLLRRGRDEYGYVAVKGGVEAEGTRTDELLRLLEIKRRAGLKMALKIGGCEAVRDLIESRQFGVDYVIAPMIESPYALSKYVQAKDKIYGAEEREDTRFLFNVETETAFRALPDLVEMSRQGGADGVVFGRVDFCGSRGLGSDEINRPEVTARCVEAAKRCRDAGLDFVVGGGVSKDALEVLREIRSTHLSRFETRKLIFDGGCLPDDPDADLDRAPVAQGLLAAVHFEILWLLNKRDHYTGIGAEDERRIAMLEARWKVLNGGAG